MPKLATVSMIVRDFDAAIRFFLDAPDFECGCTCTADFAGEHRRMMAAGVRA